MKKEKVFCEVCELICPAPAVRKEDTVKEVIEILKKKSKLYNSIDYLYVIEKNGALIGVLSIKELFNNSANISVGKIMTKEVISVSSKTQSESVAHLALKHGIKSVPVTESGKLIGMIPPNKLSKLLNNSLRKDIFHLAGIHKSHLEYENTVEAPLSKSVWHRTPWLIVGLIGIILTAALINAFEKILEKHLILAFFIPAVVYISDALGTQVQTLFIRDMAVMGEKLKVHKYIVKQTLISLIIAIVVSLLMFISIVLFWHESRIGLVISLATFSSLMVTNFSAIFITYGLKKIGKDPALGGGPFATVISDATSTVIYFLIATSLL